MITRKHRLTFGLLLAQALTACAHGGGHTHTQPETGSITVTGSGEARGAPDVVRTSIGVEARAASAQEALNAANAQVAQVIKVVKELGVAEADLRTHGFSVSYERDYVPPMPVPAAAPPASAEPGGPVNARGKRQAAGAEIATAPAEAPPPPARGSYVVHNQLEVTLREVGKLGALLSAATAAGANNIWGINFDVADKRPLIEQARAQAIENALADAKRVAALAGVKLGKIIGVSDGVLGGPMPLGVMREKAVSSNSVPVQEGELTVAHQVTLEVAIEE